jgi:hypothetical protein
MLAEADLRTGAARPPWAGDLETALDMYAVATEAKDGVVRYLVLYSILFVVVYFQKGPFDTIPQHAIDDLMVDADKSLTKAPTGRLKKDGTCSLETRFTKMRNDFIHCEDRGKDPARASQALRENVQEFQEVVANVLKKL